MNSLSKIMFAMFLGAAISVVTVATVTTWAMGGFQTQYQLHVDRVVNDVFPSRLLAIRIATNEARIGLEKDAEALLETFDMTPIEQAMAAAANKGEDMANVEIHLPYPDERIDEFRDAFEEALQNKLGHGFWVNSYQNYKPGPNSTVYINW